MIAAWMTTKMEMEMMITKTTDVGRLLTIFESSHEAAAAVPVPVPAVSAQQKKLKR